MIINIPLESGLSFQFSSHQHYVILAIAISGHTVDSSLLSFLFYWVCVHDLWGNMHLHDTAWMTLRRKALRSWFSPSFFFWVLGITLNSLGPWRVCLHLQAVRPAPRNGFYRQVGYDHRKKLFLSFGGTEDKGLLTVNQALSLFNCLDPTSQVLDSRYNHV